MEIQKTNQNSKNESSKLTAILAYCTPIGWFISYLILFKDNKNDYTLFHIRQGLGVQIIATIAYLMSYGAGVFDFIPMNNLLGWLLRITALVFIIIGIIGAINNEKKPLPVLGEKFQEWFKGIN